MKKKKLVKKDNIIDRGLAFKKDQNFKQTACELFNSAQNFSE